MDWVSPAVGANWLLGVWRGAAQCVCDAPAHGSTSDCCLQTAHEHWSESGSCSPARVSAEGLVVVLRGVSDALWFGLALSPAQSLLPHRSFLEPSRPRLSSPCTSQTSRRSRARSFLAALGHVGHGAGARLTSQSDVAGPAAAASARARRSHVTAATVTAPSSEAGAPGQQHWAVSEPRPRLQQLQQLQQPRSGSAGARAPVGLMAPPPRPRRQVGRGPACCELLGVVSA